jgi:hypothetical protein
MIWLQFISVNFRVETPTLTAERRQFPYIPRPVKIIRTRLAAIWRGRALMAGVTTEINLFSFRLWQTMVRPLRHLSTGCKCGSGVSSSAVIVNKVTSVERIALIAISKLGLWLGFGCNNSWLMSPMSCPQIPGFGLGRFSKTVETLSTQPKPALPVEVCQKARLAHESLIRIDVKKMGNKIRIVFHCNNK